MAEVGDKVWIQVKVEHKETYDGETTLFVSSDLWDGYGEIDERNVVPELSPEGKALAKELARNTR